MIYVLLPAYNEENALPILLPKIAKVMSSYDEGYMIIVCNDGSIDKTNLLLTTYSKQIPITIISHTLNRGLGESCRDLFEHVSQISKNDDVIVRLDCDDTHDPVYIPRLVDKVRNGFDVAIASRFQPDGGQLGVSKYRAFISKCANIFMKCFFPIKGVQEYSCGFRAYNASIIKKAINLYGNNFIQLKGLGFTCTLEKLVKLKMLGASFGEISFILKYDQKKSSSKMVSSVTTLGYIVMTILYHWPWGGWRTGIKKNQTILRDSNDRY